MNNQKTYEEYVKMNIKTKHPADFGKDEVYDATFGGDAGKDADYAEKNHSLDGNPDKLPNEDPEDYAMDGEPTTADEHNKKWKNEVGSETGIETEENYDGKN